MPKVRVYRYRRYDMASRSFIVSTRMATKEYIERIWAQRIQGTEVIIDERHLNDGRTDESFDPKTDI
jgi:hypothetical protein